MGPPSSLWQKVALRDAGPREMEGDGDSVPVDLTVVTELADSLSRTPSGPRALTARSTDSDWSFAPARALMSNQAAPGLRVVSTEPHITQLGAWGMIGLAATPVVAYEAWSRGVLAVGVPRLVRVHVNGPMPSHVGPIDIVLRMLAEIGLDGYAGAVLEFQGDVVEAMPAFQRAELLGAAALTQCLTAVAPLTETALQAARRMGNTAKVSLDALAMFRPDEATVYRELCVVNADTLTPLLADPRKGTVRAAAELSGKAVERVVVGGCVGGDLESLEFLAGALEDASAHKETAVHAVADSRRTHEAAAAAGLPRRLADAGAQLVEPCKIPPRRGVGLTLTTNPCLAPDGLVGSLPTLAAAWSRGRIGPGGAFA